MRVHSFSSMLLTLPVLSSASAISYDLRRHDPAITTTYPVPSVTSVFPVVDQIVRKQAAPTTSSACNSVHPTPSTFGSISNGGFESGLSGWDSNVQSGSWNVDVVSAAYSGCSALSFTPIGSIGQNTINFFQNFPQSILGATYTFRFRLGRPSSSQGNNIHFYASVVSRTQFQGQLCSTCGELGSGGSTWQTYETTVNISPSDVIGLQGGYITFTFSSDPSSTPESILLDDVQLILDSQASSTTSATSTASVCSPAVTSYGQLINGGFESGFDNWVTGPASAGQWSYAITDQAIEGCSAAAVVPISTAGTKITTLRHSLVPLYEGGTYRLRFSYSLDGDQSVQTPLLRVFISSQVLYTARVCDSFHPCTILAVDGSKWLTVNTAFLLETNLVLNGAKDLTFEYTYEESIPNQPVSLDDVSFTYIGGGYIPTTTTLTTTSSTTSITPSTTIFSGCAPTATSYGLVLNGGFESGLNFWTPAALIGNWNFATTTVALEGCSAFVATPYSPGEYRSAYLEGSLSRLSVGNTYRLAFSYGRPGGAPIPSSSPNFRASVSGQVVYEGGFCDTSDTCNIPGSQGSIWETIETTFVLNGPQPSTGGFVLRFDIEFQDFMVQQLVLIDNVSLDLVSSSVSTTSTTTTTTSTSTPTPYCTPEPTEGYGLLPNGGFENYLFNWTYYPLSGTIDTSWVDPSFTGCHSFYVAPLGFDVPRVLYLATNFSSSLITPGANYILRFALGHPSNRVEQGITTYNVTVGGAKVYEGTVCRDCPISGNPGSISGGTDSRWELVEVNITFTGSAVDGGFADVGRRVVLAFIFTSAGTDNGDAYIPYLIDNVQLLPEERLENSVTKG